MLGRGKRIIQCYSQLLALARAMQRIVGVQSEYRTDACHISSRYLEFVPTEVSKIDPSLLVETDSLLVKENDLRFPYARLSFRVHYSLPGDGRFYYMRTQRS